MKINFIKPNKEKTVKFKKMIAIQQIKRIEFKEKQYKTIKAKTFNYRVILKNHFKAKTNPK